MCMGPSLADGPSIAIMRKHRCKLINEATKKLKINLKKLDNPKNRLLEKILQKN